MGRCDTNNSQTLVIVSCGYSVILSQGENGWWRGDDIKDLPEALHICSAWCVLCILSWFLTRVGSIINFQPFEKPERINANWWQMVRRKYQATTQCGVNAWDQTAKSIIIHVYQNDDFWCHTTGSFIYVRFSGFPDLPSKPIWFWFSLPCLWPRNRIWQYSILNPTVSRLTRDRHVGRATFYFIPFLQLQTHVQHLNDLCVHSHEERGMILIVHKIWVRSVFE